MAETTGLDPEVLKMLQQLMGGGQPDFMETLMSQLPGFGLDALGSMFSAMFSGKGREKKRADKQLGEDRDRMFGMMGKDVVNPTQLGTMTQRAAQPRLQREADLLSETSDIFSPHVFGALKGRQGETLDKLMASAFEKNAFAMSARDTQLMRDLYSGSQMRRQQAYA